MKKFWKWFEKRCIVFSEENSNLLKKFILSVKNGGPFEDISKRLIIDFMIQYCMENEIPYMVSEFTPCGNFDEYYDFVKEMIEKR